MQGSSCEKGILAGRIQDKISISSACMLMDTLVAMICPMRLNIKRKQVQSVACRLRTCVQSSPQNLQTQSSP